MDGRSTTSPDRFTPVKEIQYPFHRRAATPQCLSGPAWKTSSEPGFDPRIIQPVVGRYNEYCVPAR